MNDPSARLRVAVMASGVGSNLRAIGAAIDRGDLPARLVAVVSNRSTSGALCFARARGVPAYPISDLTHDDPGAKILQILQEADADVLVLAGYLKKLDPRVVDAFEGRSINIHPAPLPRFGGRGMFGSHVHAAVLEAGLDRTGVTIHRVTHEYDVGEILAFEAVPVEPSDTPQTLAARVRAVEHDLLWRVLADFASAP